MKNIESELFRVKYSSSINKKTTINSSKENIEVFNIKEFISFYSLYKSPDVLWKNRILKEKDYARAKELDEIICMWGPR